MKGNVFNIQRFSVHDGPGIRTTVFLKGCNNTCAWCHNPESLSVSPQLLFHREKCKECGACIRLCQEQALQLTAHGLEIDRDKCTACGKCADGCPYQALEISGTTMSVSEVMETIMEDKDYYTYSGGGVTVSGGEPILQRRFLIELLKACKEQGISTAIETAGNYPWSMLESLVDYLDLVMIDFKVFDDEKHQSYVGSSNHQIKKNLVKFSQTGLPMIVRTPVITGVNDSEGEIGKIADFIQSFEGLLYYELLPYHAMGVEKERSLGGDPIEFESIKDEKMNELKMVAEKYVKVL